MPYFPAIRGEQYPATDQTQCISVYIPEGDEFKALLAGLIAIAIDPANYDDPESAQADGLAAVWDEAYTQINWDGCGVPPECISMQKEYLFFATTANISGSAYVFSAQTNARFGGVWVQSTPSNGDSMIWSRTMAPGAWYYRMTYLRNTSNAIARLRIGSSSGGANLIDTNIDLYGAAAINTAATGSFTMLAQDEMNIRVNANGKNASSSNYNLPLQSLELWQL